MGLVPPDDDAANHGMKRFDALMHRGGALYQLAATETGALTCERWSVRPTRRGRPGGDLARITREDDAVTTMTYGYQLDGQTVYLDQSACEAAHRGIQARLRWLPPLPGDPGEHMARMAGNGIPGC